MEGFLLGARALNLDSMSQVTNEPLETVCKLYLCVHVCCFGVSGGGLLDGSLHIIRGALSLLLAEF